MCLTGLRAPRLRPDEGVGSVTVDARGRAMGMIKTGGDKTLGDVTPRSSILLGIGLTTSVLSMLAVSLALLGTMSVRALRKQHGTRPRRLPGITSRIQGDRRMAKIRLKMPELSWRQETVDVPRGRTEAIRELLRAQQGRINQQLARRNEEALRELDAAEKSRGRLGNLRWLGLGVLLGGVLALLLTPTSGEAVRAKVMQRAGSAKGLTDRVSSKARTAKARVGGGDENQTAAGADAGQ